MWHADRLTFIETGILDIETNQATNMIDVAHKLVYSFMQQTATEGQTGVR